MGIISLYYIGFVPLPPHHQPESHGQDQNTCIDGCTTFVSGRGLPQRLLPVMFGI